MDIWARLPEKEISFTVEFHDLYAAVLFSVPQNLNHSTCNASWVRVALLDSVEQSKLRSECENVVFLENIREGVEEEVKNVRDSQTKFYIRWKQQMISVQCSSVGPS
jgi:hypothetical protein